MMDTRLLIIISSVMLALGKDCIYMHEYLHRSNECRPCPGCIKGYGINLTEKINRTIHVMYQCYTCKICSDGTYQEKDYLVKTCKSCDPCPNRKILRNCSKTENRICGDCLPGYFVQTNEESIVCDTKFYGNIAAITISWILFVIAVVIIILLLLDKTGKLRFNKIWNSLRGKVCFHKNPDFLTVSKKKSRTQSENQNPEASANGDSGNKNEGHVPEDPKKCLEEERLLKAQSENQNLRSGANGDSGNKNEGHVPEDPKKCLEEERLLKAQSENQNLRSGANGDSGNKNEGNVPEDPELYEPVDDKTFALNIGNNWKTVGNILDFKQAELEEIQHSETQLRDIGFAFIRKFRQKYGPENNELTKALLTIKRFDLLKRKQDNSEV